MSLLIIGMVLLWEGYKALGREGGPQNTPRAIVCVIGAGACLALSAAGMRERHRQD